MTHIAEDIFYQWVLDRLPLSAAAQRHLDACATCKATLAAVQQLAQELQIVQASTPSAEALARYSQLYDQVEQAPSLAQRVTSFLTATLQWDGRQQPAWQGVRNAAALHYRLLYMTPRVEVELMVEPRGGRFNVEGELLSLADNDELFPALLDLQEANTGRTVMETESDDEGRFHLPAIPSGHYTLWITPPTGAPLLLEGFEIS